MKALSAEARRSGLASIASILAVAGAQPWTPKAIEQHKSKELAAAPPPGALWTYFPLMRAINRGLYFFSGDMRLFSLILGGFAALCSITATLVSLLLFQNALNMVTLIMFLCTVVFLAFAGCMAMLHEITYAIGKLKVRGPAEWHAYGYSKYPGYLPPLALSIAGAALQLGRTDIRVHALVQEGVVIDPILEIEGHYCLVWDKDGNIIPPPV